MGSINRGQAPCYRNASGCIVKIHITVFPFSFSNLAVILRLLLILLMRPLDLHLARESIIYCLTEGNRASYDRKLEAV